MGSCTQYSSFLRLADFVGIGFLVSYFRSAVTCPGYKIGLMGLDQVTDGLKKEGY